MKFSIPASLCAAVLFSVLATVPASAGQFSAYTCDASFNCVSGVATSGGNFDLTSTSGSISASGLEYKVVPADTLTPAGLTTLSATYNMTNGSFIGGSPRFTIFDDAFNSAYVYFGNVLGGQSFSNPYPNGTFGSTGNYADLLSTDARVYSNGFGGDFSANTAKTFAQFVAADGLTAISYITLDLDSGSFTSDQELLVASFRVNTEKFAPAAAAVPEPMTLTLFGAGLAGAAALRRRKKMQKPDRINLVAKAAPSGAVFVWRRKIGEAPSAADVNGLERLAPPIFRVGYC